MTPEKLEKIRRLAEDPRGDPATRTIAIAALKRYAKDLKEPEPAREPFNKAPPKSAEYERHRFMALNHWRRSKNGNFFQTITHKGRGYRIILFTHKRGGTYGWLRASEGLGEVWSGRFPTIGEAHANAWLKLMEL